MWATKSKKVKLNYLHCTAFSQHRVTRRDKSVTDGIFSRLNSISITIKNTNCTQMCQLSDSCQHKPTCLIKNYFQSVINNVTAVSNNHEISHYNSRLLTLDESTHTHTVYGPLIIQVYYVLCLTAADHRLITSERLYKLILTDS